MLIGVAVRQKTSAKDVKVKNFPRREKSDNNKSKSANSVNLQSYTAKLSKFCEVLAV